MRFTREIDQYGHLRTLAQDSDGVSWKRIDDKADFRLPQPFTEEWEVAHASRLGVTPRSPWLPFEPLSIRDCSLSEKHNIDAARGLVGRFLPGVARIARIVERVTRRPFPAFRPGKLWYSQPVYYLNNPLTVVPSGTPVSFPAYSQALDYEVQLGFVLSRPIKDATPAEGEAAIGAFVVFCDFTARDKQLAEMRSGFGVQKAKHFTSSMSETAATADAILPAWREITATVLINGELVAHPTMTDARWSLGELLAHASVGEQLEAGELVSVGCFAGGSGVEIGRWLQPGDHLEIRLEGVGTVQHCLNSLRPTPGGSRAGLQRSSSERAPKRTTGLPPWPVRGGAAPFS